MGRAPGDAYDPSMTVSPAPDPDAPERAAAYALVARAAARLRAEAGAAPGLVALAADAGLSASHFQRLFTYWMGVSPKRYQQHLAGARARAALHAGLDLLEASHVAGLSGPGRLHDLMVAVAAASPGEVKTGGAGLAVDWGVVATPFGPAFLAVSARGLMKLAFVEVPAAGAALSADTAKHVPSATVTRLPEVAHGSPGAVSVRADAAEVAANLAELRADWPAAALMRDDHAAAALAQRIFGAWQAPGPLSLFVKGTQFQLRVWEALLRIPEGDLATYGGLAAVLGQPGASRAVGSAVGANPVALLIPCHRVIRASGELGGYRWGEERKRLLLAAELAWQARAPSGSEEFVTP